MPEAVRRTLAPALVVSALLLATPALAGNGGFAPVEGVSPNSDRINDAYNWVAIFTGAVFLLVQVSLVWFMIRYRRRRRARTVEGAQIHGNTKLELAWTLAPALVLVAIGSFVFYKLPGIENIPSANAAGGRLDVQVDGYRYYWNYEYPNGVIAVDNLRAPLDQNVRLQISAPDFEVIHSWWIPALGGKRDAIPGITNELWFRARFPGTYRGQCAEFCGIQHARMKATVEVLPREEFERWLEDEDRAQRERTSDLGKQTYAGACAKCHGLEGEGDIGPLLRGNGLLNNAEAVETIVRNGRGEMPPVGKDWGERQMDALTEYLEEEVQGGS